MSEQRTTRDRRSEPRHVAAGRIFWNKLDRHLKYGGWLSDLSSTGASFVAVAGRRLSIGDMIEVDLDGAGSVPQRCEVTRLAPYDRRLSLVACKTTGQAGRP